VGERLLPVQERAVKELGLLGDRNLIVFSPTSSARRFRSESVIGTRPGIFERMISFSTARYSFLSSNSSFTWPPTRASTSVGSMCASPP